MNPAGRHGNNRNCLGNGLRQFHPGGGFATCLALEIDANSGGEGRFLEVREARRVVFTDALQGGGRQNEERFFTLVFNIKDFGGKVQAAATVLHTNEAVRR